jgi:flagellar basal body-associated protein FliL
MPLRELSPDPENAACRPRRLLAFYRVLLAAAFLLLALILGGTLYALVFRGDGQGAAPAGQRTSPAASETAAGTEAAISPQAAVFTGLGRLRIPAAGGGIVVLSVAFPYYPADRPFSEELASRVRELREITLSYLGSLSAGELTNTGETLIKNELLSRYNAALRLGRIDTLYFNDFMIIE